MRKKHQKIIGDICYLHPDLNGLRYGNRQNPCIGCQKDYLAKWRAEQKDIKYGAVCEKHPELMGRRDYTVCVGCAKERQMALMKAHPERSAKYQKSYRERHPEKVKAASDLYCVTHAKERRERSRRWKNNNKERVAITERAWKEKNWDRYIARIENQNAARRYCMRAQPISKLYKKELREIYRNRPDGYHIDHIVPIKGDGVCGLHVPWNLQYLPKLENLRKGNKVNL